MDNKGFQHVADEENSQQLGNINSSGEELNTDEKKVIALEQEIDENNEDRAVEQDQLMQGLSGQIVATNVN